VVFLNIFQLLERILLLLDSLEFDLLRLQLGEEVVARRVKGREGQQVFLALKLLEQIGVKFLEKDWKNRIRKKKRKSFLA